MDAVPPGGDPDMDSVVEAKLMIKGTYILIKTLSIRSTISVHGDKTKKYYCNSDWPITKPFLR